MAQNNAHGHKAPTSAKISTNCGLDRILPLKRITKIEIGTGLNRPAYENIARK